MACEPRSHRTPPQCKMFWARAKLDLLGDIPYSFRILAKSPGFTAVAIATLAIGIGVNAAVFTITNAVLFRGFPNVDPGNRLVYINRSGCCEISYPDFEDWRAQAKSLDGVGVVKNGGLRLILDDWSGAPVTCDGTALSANAFRVLGRKPILGRDFADSDAATGAAPVAILNYGFWERRYGKDPAIIGKTVRLDGKPATLIGVMPQGFEFPHHRVDLWLPVVPTPDLLRQQNRIFWFAFGRMANGQTLQSVQAEMDIIGRRLARLYPIANRDFHPRVWTFHEFFFGPNAANLYFAIWGAVGFVLLIACSNLANLLLARAIGRSREISVRMALGARRRRIIRQLLIESAMLSSAGGLAGWLIAAAGVRIYGLLAHPPSSYDQWNFTVDYRVLAYLASISIATGLLFGLAPAIQLSKLDVNTALRDGGRGATGGRRRKSLSAILVAAEMALAVVLLSGAGLMARSFLKIYTANLGVRTANILTASVDLPAARYRGAERQMAFFDRLTARLKIAPGVDSAALADSLPGLHAPRLGFELAGAPSGTDAESRPVVATVAVSADYFRALSAALLSGRAFNALDDGSGAPVAIVNQRFASKFWQGGNALGKRLRLFDGKTPDAWRTVVGIASNIVQNDDTGQRFDPVVYLPYRQKSAPFLTVIARTRVPPAGLAAAFRREIQALDPELVIGSGLGSIEGPKPLDESLAFNYWTNGVNAALFLVFSAIALLLAAVGLYAVIAHLVGARTQEIGIRIAVGATARDILQLVYIQGMVPLGIGLAIGLAASVAVARMMKTELALVSPIDPLTLAAGSAVLVAAAVLACSIPARRAMRIDPVAALRRE
jgi:putative ABC transport system permease protein